MVGCNRAEPGLAKLAGAETEQVELPAVALAGDEQVRAEDRAEIVAEFRADT